MKRFINIFILLGGISFILLVVSDAIRTNCYLKEIFGISCPGCGLTRSFRSIINLDFISAIKYNILGIPLFLTIIISSVNIVVDIIKNDDNTIKFIFKFLKKYYILIILLLIVTIIINNINGI